MIQMMQRRNDEQTLRVCQSCGLVNQRRIEQTNQKGVRSGCNVKQGFVFEKSHAGKSNRDVELGLAMMLKVETISPIEGSALKQHYS